MKKVNSFLLILLFFITTMSFAQVNLKNGLVACYPFNANAKDESGNQHDGTLNGATLTSDRFGKANSAYNFNGSNQFIEVSPAQFQNNNYSFSIWANPDVNPPNNTYFYPFSVGGSGGDQSIDLSNSANGATGWTFGGYSLGGGRVPFCDQGFLPPPAKWYHIVGIRDNNTMTLYVDGQLVKTDNTGGLLPSYGTNTKVTIGCRSSLVQYFHGKVDDLHIYNRPLTAAEVKALYDGTPSTQTITITADKSTPCGGDKITFTANGASITAKYQWKVDGVNQGTNSKTLTFNAPNNSAQYQVKITVDVADDEPCFPKKSATAEQIFTIKNCVIPPVSTGVDLKKGLVACYPFNANAKDETGNQHDGTVNGATLMTDRFGKANSAYSFDGNSYIQLANPDDFKNNTFTYTAWVNVATIETSSSIFFAGVGIGMTHGTGVLNRLAWAAILYDNENTPYDQLVHVYTNNNINTWHHLVLVRNATQAKIYVDGILKQTSTTAIPTTPNYVNFPNDPGYVYKAMIGTRPSSQNIQFFRGVIDDIHIYNRPITATEVKALYDGESAPTITITASNPNPCGGDKVTFTANGAITSAKYQWKVDGVNQGTNSKNFIYNSPNKSADYQVKITVDVTDDDPCFPQKPVLVDKNIAVKNCVIPPSNTGDKILIPTAFTPNGDGTNDVWELTTLAGYGDLIVEIYNRWGEMVFYSKGYLESWNGTYKGSPVPEGTYAYVVRVDAERVFRGTVLVVR